MSTCVSLEPAAQTALPPDLRHGSKPSQERQSPVQTRTAQQNCELSQQWLFSAEVSLLAYLHSPAYVLPSLPLSLAPRLYKFHALELLSEVLLAPGL